MNSPNRKRPTLKMWVRVSLTIIISLGIFIPILEIYLNSIEKKQYNNKKIYSYQINQSADYKVQLLITHLLTNKKWHQIKYTLLI